MYSFNEIARKAYDRSDYISDISRESAAILAELAKAKAEYEKAQAMKSLVVVLEKILERAEVEY